MTTEATPDLDSIAREIEHWLFESRISANDARNLVRKHREAVEAQTRADDRVSFVARLDAMYDRHVNYPSSDTTEDIKALADEMRAALAGVPPKEAGG